MTSTVVNRDDLVNEFNAVVADTEQLLKSIAAAGGEKAQAMRATVEENLKAAKERLAQLEKGIEARARSTARATDKYVHANPWQSIAVAAGIAAIVGIVVGLLLNRR